MERALAVVDTGAIERNCARLVSRLTGGAMLCAVVKADGYGHGAVESARAAQAGGAEWLAVVSAQEAQDLRVAGIGGPVLVMGALRGDEIDQALAARADIAVWRSSFLEAVTRKVSHLGTVARVHVKLDTGMGRLGTTDPEEAQALVSACADDDLLVPAGLWTHFATAEEEDSSYLQTQLDRFRPLADRVKSAHPELILHAANSAATLREPSSHFDMVRCGIAIYGLDPSNADPGPHELEPALELASYVADVKTFGPGDTAGYGRRWTATAATSVGVIPIGYGDGVRRGLSNNGEVLVRGVRRPIVGTVSMDNITVDLGPDTDVEPGDEAVLIGAQGRERILCEEVAARLDTINYEITCGISPRTVREHR